MKLRRPSVSGSPALPSELRRLLRLERGERVLAVAHDPEGRPLVATDRDLLLQRRPPDFDRIGWDTVDKATYDDGLLKLTGRDRSGEDFRLRVPIVEPGVLPEVVRDRVTSSIVFTQHVALRDDWGLRVTARRRPGGESLRWAYRLDDDLAADDAEILREAERAVAETRRSAGLDG